MFPSERILACGSREEVKSAIKKAREFLIPHLGTITPSQLHQIAHDEGALALENYKSKRYEGELFDLQSREPGISLFAPLETVEHIRNYYLLIHDIKLAGKVETQVNERLWKMDLKNGTYRLVARWVEVKVDADWKHQVIVENNQVVRIEGKSGELWQNKSYAWDGTPKKSPFGFFN